jgi:UDP-N-acetylmuramoyl-tripeptide--D-alanyl-D-alanine ligase
MSTFTWTTEAVEAALGVRAESETRDPDRVFQGVSTDTRTLRPGDLYLALRGENFDGHAFVDEAVARGAVGVILVEGSPAPQGEVQRFLVPDTLVALGQLARARRLALPATVVALTGSSGKTTTKELLRSALSGARRVHATEGNLNNRVGVPLTLLAAPEDAEVVVLEVGTSVPGEIAALTHIAVPDLAILITVSEAHVEGLGSLEGVFREKLAIVGGLRAGVPVVVGDEPPELADRARALRPDLPIRVAGLSPRADTAFQGRKLGSDEEGRWQIGLPSGSVQLPVPGAHGARSALLALAAADWLGVELTVARAGMASVRLPGMRAEIRSRAGGRLLVDCYNANPQSTRAALAWLQEIPSEGPRIAVLGSMLELGPLSEDLHTEVLTEALAAMARGTLQGVVGVGLFAACEAHLPPQVERKGFVGLEGAEGVAAALLPLLHPGATVLLKGSRGVALEKALPALEEALDALAPLRSEEVG